MWLNIWLVARHWQHVLPGAYLEVDDSINDNEDDDHDAHADHEDDDDDRCFCK